MTPHDDDDDRWLNQLAGREPGDASTEVLRQVLCEYASDPRQVDELRKKKQQLALIKRLQQEALLPTQQRVWRPPLALAAGVAVLLVGGLLVKSQLPETLPDYSDSFYDYPQPKGPMESLPVRTVEDVDATLRQWKRLFVDAKLPYRITADAAGKIVEVWVGQQSPPMLREFLEREQLTPAADGWLRVLVQPQVK